MLLMRLARRVKKCFWKSDIKSNTEEENLGPEEGNPISSLRALITDGTKPQDYVNIDENVPTEAGFQALDEIIEARVNRSKGRGGDEEEEDESAGIGKFGTVVCMQ